MRWLADTMPMWINFVMIIKYNVVAFTVNAHVSRFSFNVIKDNIYRYHSVEVLTFRTANKIFTLIGFIQNWSK
jgi:hypothetical protein